VLSSAGQSWAFKNRAVQLLYFNPLSPKRLVCVLASDAASFYQPDNPAFDRLRWDTAPDFLVMDAASSQIVAARRFDSRWQWEQGYTDSPLLNKECGMDDSFAKKAAELLCRAAGADYAVVTADWDEPKPAYAVGETRVADLLAISYDNVITAMDLNGEELANAAKIIEEKKASFKCRIFPVPENLDPPRSYRVALFQWDMGDYAEATHANPKSYRVLNLSLREAIQKNAGLFSQ